jgi:hypothetical protein
MAEQVVNDGEGSILPPADVPSLYNVEPVGVANFQ